MAMSCIYGGECTGCTRCQPQEDGLDDLSEETRKAIEKLGSIMVAVDIRHHVKRAAAGTVGSKAYTHKRV